MIRFRAGAVVVAALAALGNPPAAAFQERLTIPWGSGPGFAGHREEPSGSFGPTDFAIVPAGEGGAAALYLLDREQRLIQVIALSDGSLLGTIATPPLAERLAVSGDDLAVWDGHRLHRGTWAGGFAGDDAPPYPFRTVQRLFWRAGDLVAVDERTAAFGATRGGARVPMEDMHVGIAFPRGVRVGPTTLRVETSPAHHLDIDLACPVGSVEHLGVCGDYHVVLADEILSSSPISARQVLVLIPAGGGLPAVIPLPRMHYSWLPRNVCVTEDAIYCLVSSPAGLRLFAADSTRLSDPGLGFPKLPGEPYHFNDHTPRSPHAEQGVVSGRDESPLSRSQMMANARAYVDLQWTASASNITDGIEVMPDGSSVRTPSWVTVGAKQKVPYKWGGFTSISTYAAGVPAGKKCGDDYTASVSWTDLYCVGVDCSGFVSRCWDTSQKYGTATLSQIATQLGSFMELKRGDCLNLVSSHVRLCAEDNPPGMVLTIEASAYDWRVSYRSYTLTALSSYVPMRFNWVIEEDAVAPFVIRVKDGVGSLNVREGPSTGDAVITTIGSGQRFVATSHHAGWYHFHIPSGTGAYGGWSSGGTTSANGYLEGSQGTAVATVTASELYVREGIGTSFPVITTISQGQHFAVLSTSSGWYQIQLCNTPGHTAGWASGTYLDITAGGPRDGYGASLTSCSYPGELDEGQSATVTVELGNIGQCSWDGATLLATTVPRERESLFAHPAWVDAARVAPVGAPVLPYQTHTVSFPISAPLVGSDTAFDEHFGLTQEGFCWFGDPDQRGPADDAIALSIVVHDLGGLDPPVIDPASIQVASGQLCFSWAPVAGASSYGVFRSALGGVPQPSCVSQTLGLSFAGSYGVGDPEVNVRYWVRAYAGVDSSALSQPVGEHDFALP